MMKSSVLALGLCLSLSSAAALAQTCASPLPITSPGGAHEIVSGDTCAATNDLPSYGGTTSPQKEIIYSFVANSANTSIYIMQDGGFGGSSAAMFLLSACNSSTDPSAFGFEGTPMAVKGLTNGNTYYVVVTADPGSAPASCGQYTAVVTGVLPVALKNFVVD